MTSLRERTEQRQIDELVSVLWFLRRRARTLGLCLLIGVLVGALFERTRHDLYQGSVALVIGSVGVVGQRNPRVEDIPGGDPKMISGVRYHGLEPGRRLLSTPSELYRILSAQYSIPAAIRGKVDPPFINNIDNLSGDGIKIFAKGETPAQIEKFLDTVLAKILKDHAARFFPTQKILLTMRESLVEQKKGFEAQANPASELVDLSKLIYEVERALSPINTHPSRSLGPVQVEEKEDPKDLLAAVIGGFISLLIGVLLILIIDLAKLGDRNRSLFKAKQER